MFLAGTSARNAAAVAGRTTWSASSLLRGSQTRCTPHEATIRPLAASTQRQRGGRGREYPGGRTAAQRKRTERAHQNASAPRFQQFGRAGGEGERVAEHLYEDFGMSSMKEFSPETAEAKKGVLRWLEGELSMSPRAIADMVEQEPRVATQETEALSARLTWLKGRLGLSDEQVRSLVHRRPSVLCRSVDDGMEKKVRREKGRALLWCCAREIIVVGATSRPLGLDFAVVFARRIRVRISPFHRCRPGNPPLSSPSFCSVQHFFRAQISVCLLYVSSCRTWLALGQS